MTKNYILNLYRGGKQGISWVMRHQNSMRISTMYCRLKEMIIQGWRDLAGEVKLVFTEAMRSSPEAQNLSSELSTYIQQPIRFVFMVLAITTIVFVVWGGIAPLDSASIAQGHVALSGNRKTIQHQEGGTIEQILVEEGDVVEEGQVLIKLNDTAANARVQITMSQLRTEKAVIARLLAQRDGLEAPDFRDEDLRGASEEVQSLLKTQTDLFIIWRKTLSGQLNVLQQRIAQQQELINGLEAQEKSMLAQTKLIRQELKNVQALYDRGLALQSRLLEMRRVEQELEGRIGEMRANMARARENIAETELQLLNVENETYREINDALKEARGKLLDLQEQYRAAADVLARCSIKAPNAGIVTGLEYHTIGGVIAPGSRILDIIPQNDKLLIEVKVAPRDIESIHVGLTSRVQLSAYKARLVPRVEGVVTYISADRFHEPQNPMMPYYYLAKIEISEKELASINYDVKLYPGMPAEVFIVKGERTFLQYLLSPIMDSFHRAFKEA